MKQTASESRKTKLSNHPQTRKKNIDDFKVKILFNLQFDCHFIMIKM